MDINLGLTTLTINPATQADVWQAFEKNESFPDRTIAFGDINAKYASGNIPFNLGGGAHISLTASFSAGGQSGIGIYGSATDAVKSLGLDPSVTPDFPAGPDDRFLLLGFSATAQGSVSGSAPVGVVSSVTFGAQASGATRFAILYRFNKATGARTVLEQAGPCIKLPRTVAHAEDLLQGTWIIAEADGSLALSLAANVGYDYTYTRDLPNQLQQAGLSNDLSVKVDAAAKATVGYNVSGRYLVMVGRPSLISDEVIALQINKGSSYGYNFGLDLSVGVQMSQVLPKKGEDLAAATFGVFGPQIVADVSKSISTLETWANGDLGANAAALTTSTAKSLLTAVTGVNADNAISEATGKLKDALTKWNALVGQGSTELQTLSWNLLGNPSDKALILKLLTDLRDKSSLNQTLSDGLQSLPGQSWLMGIAEAVGAASPLSLGTYQNDVKKIAGYAVDVLSDGDDNILMKLQTYISDRFKLTDIIATASDPTKLDQWVQNRLAAFLNKTALSSTDLKNIQAAIKTLLSKFDDLYSKITTALTKKYNFEFAATYEKTLENATLLNLSFDLAKPDVSVLYQGILAGNTSAIFNLPSPLPGLTINNAVMSHGIHSTAKTSLTLPYLSSQTSALNDSVAKLTFEQNGANLVGYLDATDQVRGDRFSSMLKLALKLGVKGAPLTSINESLAYELRAIASNASKAMVTQATAPFVTAYLADKFAPNDYSDKLLADFDHAVDLPASELGDMVMSMQLAIDGDFLSAWVIPAAQLVNAKLLASRTVQRCLRDYTHRLYFRKVSQIDSWATLPLLVWQSFPICTGTDWDPNAGTLGNTNTGKDLYFDDGDDRLIKALVNASSASGQIPQTWGLLDLNVAFAYQEVVAAGIKNPKFIFSPPQSAAQQMVGYVMSASGFPFLKELVLAEAGVINGVAKALDNINAVAASISASDPSKLLDHLAEFGTELTMALNKHMTNLFAGGDLRLFGPMLFVELTKALASGRNDVRAKAMLELKSLKPKHTFDITSYVSGSEPGPDQIAVSQTVVSV